MAEELKLFVKWVDFINWLLDTTDKFPKKIRFSFTSRIDNLALDILENIIELRYDREQKKTGFMRINIRFEKLRVLLRICHEKQYLSNRQYEHAATCINEVGRMTAGWLKAGQ